MGGRHYYLGEDLARLGYKMYLIVASYLSYNARATFKIFEYIAYKKPVISVKGTTVGAFIEENDIGGLLIIQVKH